MNLRSTFARPTAALSLGLSAAAFGSVSLLSDDVRACGGCFHPPTQVASDITDERMLLSVSQTQTTLYDQIRYVGSPTSFAWVLPIHGTVDVGLSADVLFDSLDSLTATTIQAPASSCSGPPASCGGESLVTAPGAAGASAGDDDGDASVVTVTKAQNVGPYATVQLHATDSSALNDWLTTNGFDIPDTVAPIIAQYVSEGFDFLAMKLLPDQGVQAMRPVRVTTPGASLSLPLRMAAIGTGTTVGITLWVVSDGRYEPQNFPFFHIEDTDLIWDWDLSASNYTTLRSQNETALGGKGWEIESSLDLSQTTIANTILSGGFVSGFGGPVATSNAGDDYLPIPAGNSGDGGASDGGGLTTDGGAGESADQVRADDIAALFAGLSGPNVRVTRIRSDIAHAAMTVDFKLQASADQGELSNNRVVTKSVNEVCPVYQNCSVVGTAPVSSDGGVVTAASSDGGAGTATNAANGDEAGGGCAVMPSRTPTSKGEAALRFGLFAGAFGLVASRLRRRKRQR